MKNIGIDQSLRNSYLSGHVGFQNFKKLYQHAGKCDNQQQFKDIFESDMVSTTKLFTNNSPRSPMNPTPVKKQSARKTTVSFH